jgi:hypothetical protein
MEFDIFLVVLNSRLIKLNPASAIAPSDEQLALACMDRAKLIYSSINKMSKEDIA